MRKPCCSRSVSGGELRQVLERRDRHRADVVLGHPDEVRGAGEDPVLGPELAHVAGVDLRVVAEQAVPVHRRPHRVVDVEDAGRGLDHRRARDVAGEARLHRVAGRPLREPVRAEVVLRAGRAAGLVEVAGHRVGPGDLADVLDPVVGRGREVGDVGDLIVRRVALGDPVVEVGVAELRVGVVADRQHPLGQVALAGDGEVPGHVEARALDPRLAELAEDLLEVGAPVSIAGMSVGMLSR